MNSDVAIIGAGLSGLALALALHNESIPCTLYEARSAPLDTGGGLMLTPNGLKVLQRVGIYDKLLDRAFSFNNIYFQLGPTGAIVDTIEYGNVDRYGMSALRAYRFTVLELLLARVQAQGIPIHFNHRFSHIVNETADNVTWQFTDGRHASAALLVGADGIHSTVRGYLAPGIAPRFGGFVTLVAAVPTAQLGLPAADLADLNRATNKHPLPSGIVVPQCGAFVSAPQTKNGDELMITVMRTFPDEPPDARWGPLDADKDRLRAMFRGQAERFPEAVQRAVADIPDEQLRVWPGYQIPELDDWTSARVVGAEGGGESPGRVVILGDAAHALPPSAGQGVNQAFEDVYLFAAVLGRLRTGNGGGGEGVNGSAQLTLRKVLRGWQRFRQERVDGVLRLNKLMEMVRLPAAARAEQGFDADPESIRASMKQEFDSLFKIDLVEAVDDCLRRGEMD